MPPSQSSVRVARDLVTAISRLRRRIRDVSGLDQLTPSQTSALGLLAKGGPAGTSALAAAERVRPQSMAATLSVLEQRGLVQRRPDPTDGRRQIVSLTAAGQRLHTGGRTARHEWLVDTAQRLLTEEERQTLIEAAALMQRLTEA